MSLHCQVESVHEVCGARTDCRETLRAYLEGISPISTGLRAATMSGVKLVRTSASPSGSRLTAPYKQLHAPHLHQRQSTCTMIGTRVGSLAAAKPCVAAVTSDGLPVRVPY